MSAPGPNGRRAEVRVGGSTLAMKGMHHGVVGCYHHVWAGPRLQGKMQSEMRPSEADWCVRNEKARSICTKLPRWHVSHTAIAVEHRVHAWVGPGLERAGGGAGVWIKRYAKRGIRWAAAGYIIGATRA